MKEEIVQRLIALNREFYQTFAGSFSTTRYSVQPGVQRVLASIPKNQKIIDLGCGNGNILNELSRLGFSGEYIGTDFSAELIQAARRTLRGLQSSADFTASFYTLGLLDPQWLHGAGFAGAPLYTAFASFHHIPGKSHRDKIFSILHDVMRFNSQLIFSVWQPQNSERLRRRFHLWDEIGLKDSDVEPGDVLLDWKAEQSATGHIGYRYVHVFSEDELGSIASRLGFSILESFYSDGKQGNLGLYQLWQKLE